MDRSGNQLLPGPCPALVADYFGEPAALGDARQLVMYLKRPWWAGSLQRPAGTRLATRRLEDFRHHISQNIATPFTLTEHAHVSERQLAQIFRTELGTAPATYLESARVEAARNRLGSTNDTLERVASACGFKTTDTLIRAL